MSVMYDLATLKPKSLEIVNFLLFSYAASAKKLQMVNVDAIAQTCISRVGSRRYLLMMGLLLPTPLLAHA